MNNLLSYFLEANLYLISFYLLYQLLLAKGKHFRFNRTFLLMGVLLSITLPLISFNMKVDVLADKSLEGYIILPALTISNVQTESVGFIVKWWHILGVLYFSGILFYGTRLIWQLIHILRHLPINNSSRERKANYTLITTNGELPTCSFFRFLFWDRSVELNEDEQKQIMEHELVHIRQGHSFDVLLIEILRTIFWINPVIHQLKSRITEVHEYLADHDATKEIGIEKYSKLLTLQIFKSFDFALSNNFHKSQVIKRIRMLKSKRSKKLWLNVALLIPSLALLITVLACDVTDMEEIIPLKEIVIENNYENEVIENESTSEEIFTIVENQPTPKDDMESFYDQIQKSLKYPEAAKNAGIEGKVFVQFVVDKKGNITDVKAVKGIGGGCDKEAIRVIKESATWNPGSQRGKKVNVRMIMPITFKLG
jgi:TonB family protein